MARKSSLRGELIECAAELLDKGGVAAVTLRAVGEAAGVSHNAPYRHFASKDELLAAIAAREMMAISTPGERTLREMLLDNIQWARRSPERFKLVFGRWSVAYSDLDEAALQAQKSFFEAVERSQQNGELPKGDPVRLGAILRTLIHGAADLELSGHLAQHGKLGGVTPESILDDLFAILNGKTHFSSP